MEGTHNIGLGGGCHWCTEAVFQAVPGVSDVRQGYVSSMAPYESFSEAVLIEYDATVSLLELLDIHLETHASTAQHSRRDVYRSAVYYMDTVQMEAVRIAIDTLSRKRNKKYITLILPFFSFKPSRDSLQDYYKNKPDAPFCKKYIAPKLGQVHTMIKNRDYL